jgi:hypothetical protein
VSFLSISEWLAAKIKGCLQVAQDTREVRRRPFNLGLLAPLEAGPSAFDVIDTEYGHKIEDFVKGSTLEGGAKIYLVAGPIRVAPDKVAILHAQILDGAWLGHAFQRIAVRPGTLHDRADFKWVSLCVLLGSEESMQLTRMKTALDVHALHGVTIPQQRQLAAATL